MSEGWKDRLIEEKSQLDERLTKLQSFLTSTAMAEVSPENRELLRKQEASMIDYQDILQQRLELNK